ncbi:hypothetical protein [Solibacillus sp. FSL W8-0372]|uniref:hypothetical protein n=1 Tax=Solibacillus sp. FSL W8-0372 TaxID=2921713 RepID=UPI0030D5A7C4
MDKSEERFLAKLAELIKEFQPDKMPSNTSQPLTLDTLLNHENISPKKSHRINTNLDFKFNEFVEQLEKTEFYQGLIPYDKITECVFDNTPPEMLYTFTGELRNRGNEYFQSKTVSPSNEEDVSLEEVAADMLQITENRILNEEVQSIANEFKKVTDHIKEEIMFLKIVRHIDLALIQKNSIANVRLREMDELKTEHASLKQNYLELKKEADTQYRNMLTQFISILGIFAAILMGAFGAIQGFANIFANASDIPLGNLLIISSMGASSVLLILFFLLNGIAKLTGRSLNSSDSESTTLLDKHPTIVMSHGILIGIALVGAALTLSNIQLKFALQGLWWFVPLIWFFYFLIAINRKDFFFLFKWNFYKSFSKKDELQKPTAE